MSTINPHAELLAALRRGATVVTVNRRLQRTLSEAYDNDCLQQGLIAWAHPAITTREAFLRDLSQRLPQPPLPLSAAQSSLLWQQIIEADIAATEHALLQVPATARSARAAAVLLARYRVNFAEHHAANDQKAFLRWHAVWQQRTAPQGWIDPDALAPVIIEALAEGHTGEAAGGVALPDEVVFAGFDDLAPDEQQLRQALADRGCRVSDWQPAALTVRQRLRVGCVDPEAEVCFAAQTAAELLRSTPQARIGIVVAQLSAYLPLLQTRFFAELDPQAWTDGQPRSPLVNISLGRSLDRSPPVYAALRLLRFGAQVPLDDIGWLLRTPWLDGEVSERLPRALAEADLRARKLAQWPLSGLLRVLKDKKVPRFVALLDARQKQLRGQRRQLPGAWGEQLARELQTSGWPGDRPLDSDDYQAVSHFREQLASLACFDLVSPPVDRGEALALLSTLCAETLFQPESGEAPVQILGLLEAVGQRFDTLIVLGLHDGAFPAPCNPNPFIPLPLQRQWRMPHADAERERDFAQKTAAQLFSAADNVLLCWPQQIDGTPRRPSPMLADIANLEREPIAAGDAMARQQALRPALDAVADRQAPPIHAQSPVSGGTGLIKDQALCPFRAFAHHRLRAKGFDEVDLGLDGMERGSLVHSVLELFWAEVGDQKRLQAFDEPTLAARLADCIEQALLRFEAIRRCDLPPLSRRLEASRLQQLAMAWLQLDRNREPFTTQVEIKRSEQVGPLQINTRVDRLDTLADGSLAIIDYKTGRVDARVWLDARLSEPQLPIYCQNLPADEVAAVLFASLRNGGREVGFNGVAADPDRWPGLRDGTQQKWLADAGIADYVELLGSWKPALTALGKAFVAGDAAVTPLDGACHNCDLQPLCRIHEAGDGSGGEGEE